MGLGAGGPEVSAGTTETVVVRRTTAGRTGASGRRKATAEAGAGAGDHAAEDEVEEGEI